MPTFRQYAAVREVRPVFFSRPSQACLCAPRSQATLVGGLHMHTREHGEAGSAASTSQHGLRRFPAADTAPLDAAQLLRRRAAPLDCSHSRWPLLLLATDPRKGIG